TIFASDREGPMAGMVQFLPNKRLGAILVISAQPKYLARAESWVRRLDAQAEGSEKQFFTYSVQNRRAQELVDVLQTVFSHETGSARTNSRNVAPQYREASAQSRTAQPAASSYGSGTAGTTAVGLTGGMGSAAGVGMAAMGSTAGGIGSAAG